MKHKYVLVVVFYSISITFAGHLSSHACTTKTNVFYPHLKKKKEKIINRPTLLHWEPAIFSHPLLWNHLILQQRSKSLQFLWNEAVQQNTDCGLVLHQKTFLRKSLACVRIERLNTFSALIRSDLGWWYICILFIFCIHIFDYT